MKFNWKVVIAVAALAAAPTLAATISDDFESYALGSLDGQAGPGGISWSKTSLGGSADAYAALPGYNSPKSGRWDVKDIGTVSEGDDMLGAFAAIGPQVTLTAWTYSFLSVDPLFTGKRNAEFSLLDGILSGVGIGLVWRADGKLGDTNGNVSAINFVNQQWKQIQIDIDYAAGTYATYYDGNLVSAGALAGVGNAAAVLNIFLETKNLSDVPNPNDSFLVDDIMITPEPASLALLALAGLLIRRR
ncbi:MAG: hypothetical protein IPM13_05940 [Phycisphaerales bacterium]|nr:hypothetical protein [Phycisphaerales bacterium]